MVIGSVMLIFVHTMFALPILNIWWFATVIMIILGFAFSLVIRQCGLRLEDYSGETVGNGLCVDLLGTELGIDGRAFADWMGVEFLLQRSGCRWCTDL